MNNSFWEISGVIGVEDVKWMRWGELFEVKRFIWCRREEV